MGGSSHEEQKTQQVQQNTIDPEQKALLMGNYATAQGNAAKLDTPYGGLLTAGFNPTQQAAQGIFAGLSSDPRYMNNANQATSAIGGVLGSPLNGMITPKAISPTGVQGSTYNASTYDPTGYDASLIGKIDPYSAAQLSSTDLKPYMNPYQNDVITATMAQLSQQRGQQQVADNASATAAHAFGGSRQAVQNALTTEGYDRNTGGILAGLNSDNFRQAQQGALADIGARNNASQFNNNMAFNVGNANAGAINNARQFSAGAANTAGQYNAGARNTAGQFNAGQNQAAGIFSAMQDLAAQQYNSGQDMNAQQGTFANNMASQGMTLNAAGQLQNANNNALGVGIQQAGLLGAVGDIQQQQEQAGLSNAYQNWLAGQQMTVTEQQMLNSALGLMPNQQTVTTNGTGSASKTTNPGVSDIMQGVGAMGMGLGSMGLGFADVPAKVLRFDRDARRWASFRYIPEVSGLREAA